MPARNVVPEGLYLAPPEGSDARELLVVPGRCRFEVCSDFCAWFRRTYPRRRPDLREVFGALPVADWIGWPLWKVAGESPEAEAAYGLFFRAMTTGCCTTAAHVRRVLPFDVFLDALPVEPEPNVCPWVELRAGGLWAMDRQFLVCRPFKQWFRAKFPGGCSLDVLCRAIDRPAWLLWLWYAKQPDEDWSVLADKVCGDWRGGWANYNYDTQDPELCDQLREAFPLEALVDILTTTPPK